MTKNNRVILIAFEEFDNLGVRYPAAVLEQAGFKTSIIDLKKSNEEILTIIKKFDPVLTGFSVVYQYNIERFIKLVHFLRKREIKCHFTAGGHYSSLKVEELFALIPGIDSVVRFEGEYTLLELVKSLCDNTGWINTTGIAYNSDGRIIYNKLRPFEKDLDKFPFPKRSESREYAFEKRFATLIAGRGCVNDCAFCNSKEFYTQSSGPRKRLRKPEMVADEMEFLHSKNKCSVFLFQDDDFPVRSPDSVNWISRFCSTIKNRGLDSEIMWKINCRPDEIEKETFSEMKNAGLFLVFLGIDDGTDEGLKWINKHMTAGSSLKGINTLKELSIGFDYGFMLFQPRTTFKTLVPNLDFLEKICGDGYTPLTFLKMMPYYETAIERYLKAEQRLIGKPGFRDYNFLEESMNRYFKFITSSFNNWLNHPEGLVNMIKWTRNYFLVFQKHYPSRNESIELFEQLTEIISESNLYFLKILKSLAMLFESEPAKLTGRKELLKYRKDIDSNQMEYKKAIRNIMYRLFRLAYRYNSFYLPK
jgi:radical SAM superfamily enzyme YgiQ (UPF0313 family)